ncbi:zonular occludens toxin domain-containing protein [Rhodoferax sp. TBRC 17660]|uniref:Zonular occludens toxin domain-containing protein n=1 Tax=Rhodoferax potami TaxID=3068338 RepID=A0ABU3KKJ7_9BURK|nr:zonular occludens toxin domain-containing protein [Rhodoferax sp. TBRC 17660]MDT7518138.1 zonular occludens toxin domain-containing protein [Rhodoferax sp. TBRC 17660]
MLNGLQGIPGSGKSYEATVYHVLAALKRGRKVITNLPLNIEQFSAIDPAYADLIEVRRRPAKVLGTWDANRVDDKGNGLAFEVIEGYEDKRHSIEAVETTHGFRGNLSAPVAVFGNVWDYYTEWKHPETGQGPLFVVDECHVPMPRTGTSVWVIEWYKLHRHFNVDVLLMTQNFRHMNGDIADLLAMLIKVRKADILGKKNEYIRRVHGGFRGAVISEEVRPYKPEFFQLYKSHTQGNSVSESSADDVTPAIVKFKRYTRILWVCILLGAVFVGYRIFAPKSKTVTTVTVEKIDTPTAAAAPAGAASGLPVVVQGETSTIPEPYENQSIHMTGRIKMGDKETYTFTLAQNGLVVNHITDTELRKAGYKFTGTSDCTGFIEWDKKARAVSCNFPSQQMAAEGIQKKG